MDLFSKDQVEFILKDRDSESAIIKRRVYLAGLFILLFITLLISRVFFLTVIQNDHYTTKAKENRQKILPIAPIRGLIFFFVNKLNNLTAKIPPVIEITKANKPPTIMPKV